MGDDDDPHHSSCSAATATTSGGSSSSSPSPSPSLPLAAAPLPPPFPAIAVPQQLLQQYQLRQLQQQQQRLFSLHLPSAAVVASSTSPPTLTLKHPLPLLPASPSPVPAFPSGATAPPDRHSRDDCWSEGATFTLIEAWGDRFLELNCGNLKQKHWKDVADAVNRRSDGTKAPKTDIQCKNRIDTLKKKYKLEKSRIVVGSPRKWAFFDRLDELIGASKKPKKPMLKLRPSVPLLPLPAKRPLEDAEQGPQIHPPFGSASKYCPSPAANHVTPSHTGPAPNHGASGLNYVGSCFHHAAIVPYNANSNPNHLGNGQSQFRSNNHHVASAVNAISKSKESPHSADSCPNGESSQVKRVKRKRSYVDPLHDLAQAITKFGEVYERTEIARQQILAEIEKQRMIFAKDLERQRLQLFTQTQVELAKLGVKFKRGKADHNP